MRHAFLLGAALLLAPPAAGQFSLRAERDLAGTYTSSGQVPATGSPRSLDESTSIEGGFSLRAEVLAGDPWTAGLGVELASGRSLQGHDGSFSTRAAYARLGYRSALPWNPSFTLRGGPSLLGGDETYEDRSYSGVGYNGLRQNVPVQFPAGYHVGIDVGAEWKQARFGIFWVQHHHIRRYRENAETASQVNRLIDLNTVITRFGVSVGVGL